MNNLPFIPLDVLKNRPVPQKKQTVIIEFDKSDTLEKEIDTDNIKPVPQIFDKRNDYNLNRNDILKRLKSTNAFAVPVNKNFLSKRPQSAVDVTTIAQPSFATKTDNVISISDAEEKSEEKSEETTEEKLEEK